MFKFLHAADIHLDSPLRGLERYEGAPVEHIRQATRRAFENLVRLALDEQVQFVLIAGDLYDGSWKDYNTGLYFIGQMRRLAEAGIPVFLIAGNHDAANRMTKTLRLPDHVKLLSAEEPETCVLEDIGVAIHGQSFATQAVLEDLSARYPAGWRGYFNIGLLHTSVTGREGHDSYAPCTIDSLRRKHYDYWALGHIHQREVLHPEAAIVFPGNIQGRHIRETGAKGCMLVRVEQGRQPRWEFRGLDVVRWERCVCDVRQADDADAVAETVARALRRLRQENDGRWLAVRVEVTGPCPAHDALMARSRHWSHEIRAQALDVGGAALWIEKVLWHTTPPRAALPNDGPIGELLALLHELRADDTQLQRLRGELADLEAKLPMALTQGPDALRFDDPHWLRGLLDQVEPLLLHRLLCGEADQ
ncbi:MAG: exonuclease SbcCD subunit D [Gemmataceae bacterium]